MIQMNVNMFHFYFSRNNVITSLKEINNRNSKIKVSFKIVVEKLMQWTCMRYLFDQEPAKKCTLMILSYLNDGYIMILSEALGLKIACIKMCSCIIPLTIPEDTKIKSQHELFLQLPSGH